MSMVIAGKSGQNIYDIDSNDSPVSSLETKLALKPVLTGEKTVAGVQPVDRHIAPLGVPASEKRFFFQRGSGYDPNAIATQVHQNCTIKMYIPDSK